MGIATALSTSQYNRSIHILREAKAEYPKLALMWAGGKDSTLMLHLARDAYYNELPTVIFLDTTYAFRETLQFIRSLRRHWRLPLVYAQNREALCEGINPWSHSHLECCTKLKTDALHQIIERLNLDALCFAIRHDEHTLRGKEQHFSPRDLPDHMRIHPILHWTEPDVWNYIHKYDVPVNPLYNRRVGGKRYYSLGCYPCTSPLTPSEHASFGERGGRTQDKEQIMERLRALGYM